jgi:hypothetical protein
LGGYQASGRLDVYTSDAIGIACRTFTHAVEKTGIRRFVPIPDIILRIVPIQITATFGR